MFERFTESAIKVIMIAQREAIRLHYNHVGVEHMFLGLLAVGKSGEYAGELRASADIQETARSKIKQLIGEGDGYVAVEIPFTDEAKRVLEDSWQKSRQMGHQYISEEHLFLALLAEQNLNVLQTLEFLGIDVAQLKTHLMSKLPPADRLTASAVETEEQVESLKRSINAWRNRAEMALQHGKTDLAQVALERKELLEKRLAEIEKEHDS